MCYVVVYDDIEDLQSAMVHTTVEASLQDISIVISSGVRDGDKSGTNAYIKRAQTCGVHLVLSLAWGSKDFFSFTFESFFSLCIKDNGRFCFAGKGILSPTSFVNICCDSFF